MHRFNEKFYRVDFNNKVKEGYPGRVLLSLCDTKKLMNDKRYITPQFVEATSAHIAVTDIGSEGKSGNFYVLYQGARTNGHAVISIVDDLLDNIAYVRSKKKISVRTFNIQYSQTGAFSATSNMGNYVLNMVKMIFGSFSSVTAFTKSVAQSSLSSKRTLKIV
jgi:hypothetical protein